MQVQLDVGDSLFVHCLLVSSAPKTMSGTRQVLRTIFWNKRMDEHWAEGFGVPAITAFHLSLQSRTFLFYDPGSPERDGP